jgi:hypothetical protein
MEQTSCPLCRAAASADRKSIAECTYICCENCKDFILSHVAERMLETMPLFRAECITKARRATSRRLLAITATHTENDSVVLGDKMIDRDKNVPAFNSCMGRFKGIWLV